MLHDKGRVLNLALTCLRSIATSPVAGVKRYEVD